MRGLLEQFIEPGNHLKTKQLKGFFLCKPTEGYPFVFVGEHETDDPNGNSIATKPVSQLSVNHLSTGTDVIIFSTEEAEYQLFLERTDDANEEVISENQSQPRVVGGEKGDGDHSQNQTAEEGRVRTEERDVAAHRLETLVRERRNKFL